MKVFSVFFLISTDAPDFALETEDVGEMLAPQHPHPCLFAAMKKNGSLWASKHTEPFLPSARTPAQIMIQQQDLLCCVKREGKSCGVASDGYYCKAVICKVCTFTSSAAQLVKGRTSGVEKGELNIW